MSPSEEAEALEEIAVRVVLDDVAPEERPELERRLAADPRLAEAVARLRATLDLLPHAAVTAPPAHLKSRVMRAADRRRDRRPVRTAKSRTWGRPSLGTLAALAASVAAVVLAWDGARLRRDLELQREVATMLQEPNVVVSFQLAGTGEGAGGVGTVSLDLDDEKGAIAIRSLEPLGEDHVYALWARVAEEDVPCGQFRVDADGRSLTQFAVPVDSYTAPIAKLFVTVEPKAVPPKPSGPVVMESV
jgi:anti-sigma-K factor RskA